MAQNPKDEETTSNQGGITNRGRDRELSEQQHLPERGKSQEESSADRSSDSSDRSSDSSDRSSGGER